MFLIEKVKITFRKLLNNPRYFFEILLFRFEIGIYFFLLTPLLYINLITPKDKRFYFAKFRADRIGHFAPGFHIRYAKKKLKIETKNCLYAFDGTICNLFLAKQIKKYFFVNRLVNFIIILCDNLPLLRELIDKEPFYSQRDKKGFTQKTNMPNFTNYENQFCQNWLTENGWKGPSQKIVLFHIRDSLYLDKISKKNSFSPLDFSYHKFRDSNIDDFLDSIEWVLNKDAFVIRTGKLARERANIKSKFFLDYPFLKSRHDILDIWLFAKSDLVISTASGIDEISAAYRVPRLYVNLLPLIDTPSWTKSLTSPKHLFWKKNHKHLTLDEYIKIGRLNQSKKFNDAGINIRSLTSLEILNSTVDAWNYFIEGTSIKEDDLLLTSQFREFILKDSYLKNFHESINKKWIISSNIFSKN